MSRLTPLRTRTLKPGPPKNAQHFLGWSRDQPIEFPPHVRLGDDHAVLRTVHPRQHEPELAVARLLVALHRLPGTLAIDRYGPRAQHLLHDTRVTAGEAQRGEQAERDCPSVRHSSVAGRGFERVRERVAEVQDRPLPAL